MRGRVLLCTALVLCAFCIHSAVSSIPSKAAFRKVTEAELAANAVSQGKLQKDAVSGRNIQPQAVDGSKIARNSVESRHLHTSSVSSRSMALEQVTIILRSTTPVSATGGGAGANPDNRIALKPLNSDSRVEHHHVAPGNFHRAFGRASGPGVIVGWFPSLNGHLLRYQADRGLRDISCSGVPSIDHMIRKYDVNIADYQSTIAFDTVDGTVPLTTSNQFLARFIFTGTISNETDVFDILQHDALINGSSTERWPGVFFTGLGVELTDLTGDAGDSDCATNQCDTFVSPLPDDMKFFSSLATRSSEQAARLSGAVINSLQSGIPGGRDYDLRGTRDVHYLSHRYEDLEYSNLCGDLMTSFGPDNVKCWRARPWQERRYRTNDMRSLNTGDTEDNERPDIMEPNAPVGVIRSGPQILDRGFVDVLHDTTTFPGPEPIPATLWEHASPNSPPERCSIYTNIGDVRLEEYQGLRADLQPVDNPGPAEGTPMYSPSLERISIDDTGLIEVRYAGRGMPGASQPDIAITVMVLRNDNVEYQTFDTPLDVFP